MKYTRVGGLKDDESIWIEGEEFSAMLERLGYNHSSSGGDPEDDRMRFASMRWHFHKEDDRWILIISDVDGCEAITGCGRADLLALRVYLAPLVALDVRDELEHINRATAGAFRAWHGHDAQECCHRCHPYEWDALQRRRKEIAAKKKAASKQP